MLPRKSRVNLPRTSNLEPLNWLALEHADVFEEILRSLVGFDDMIAYRRSRPCDSDFYITC